MPTPSVSFNDTHRHALRLTHWAIAASDTPEIGTHRYLITCRLLGKIRDRWYDPPPPCLQELGRQFEHWEALLAARQLAPALVNTLLDPLHLASTLAALAGGYDILLEKPMALDVAGVRQLVAEAEGRGRLLMVCHVLRYAPFFQTVHQIVCSGRLGPLITVAHRENVVFWHMAHAFVRGNWRNHAVAPPMILARCCHDLDLLVWNLGRRCERVASFGTLSHYWGADPGQAGSPHHAQRENLGGV